MATSVREKLIDELDLAIRQREQRITDDRAKESGPPLRILYSAKGLENPYPVMLDKEVGAPAGVSGAFSLEKFASAGSLKYTHEDAEGWLNYLAKFNSNNFWYKDTNVRIWAYYEQYDNWQNAYGMDAVRAVYHSGHGGMTDSGDFHVPLGEDWGGQGTTAWSNKMRLGNEQVRYVFWSTCLSCRVSGKHSPARTWAGPNLGFRMIFGYETTSWDNPNYGKYFWDEWNKNNNSFSTAFLNASWRIAHDQSACVAACGSTKEEAQNRVFNERYLYSEKVNDDWWWWRWILLSSSARGIRALNQDLPDRLLIAQLQPVYVDGAYVENILVQHNVGIEVPREVMAGPNGTFTIGQDDLSLAVNNDGSYELKLAEANRKNTDQIDQQHAIDIASDYVDHHDIARDDIEFDRVARLYESGSERDGTQTEGPYITETMVQFTQYINGLPVLQPGQGCITVYLDNDGTVTRVKNATQTVVRLTDRAMNPPTGPGEEEAGMGAINPERLLDALWETFMRDWVARGGMPIRFRTLPDSYEVGYTIRDNRAFPVAHRDVEVEFGDGYYKRYALEVPLLE